MSLTMHIYNTKEIGFDVSEIVHDIEYTTSILGQAGKLTFTLEKDLTPNSEFQIDVGSLVKFWHSDDDDEKEKPVFLGHVFTVSTDSAESCRVVAYDSTRYLQNHENLIIPERENNLEYFFNLICTMEKFGKSEIVNWNKYITGNVGIRGQVFQDESAFNILLFCMEDYAVSNFLYITAKNFNMIEAGLNGMKIRTAHVTPRFYIRDNFGTLQLREIFTDFIYNDDGTEKNEFIIVGDESLLTDYQYEVDIDKDTFNEFYFMYNKTKNGANNTTETNRQVDEKSLIVALQAGTEIKNTNTKLDGQVIGEDTIPKWGSLRKIITLNDSTLDGNAVFYIKELVELFNKPTRSMRISALGYDGLYAGNSFIFSLKKLKINYPAYIISATHRYDGGSHTMDLEVNTNPMMELYV